MEPSDAIWRHGSWSTLAQVIACCLTAPSNYLNQCWGTYDIHLRAISQEIPHPPNTNYKLASKLLIYICFQIHQGPIMMTSSNGNIFRVTGHLCRKFTGEFPAQRPVTWSFDVFFDLHPNKRLSKQSSGWWFDTPACPLWRHSNEKPTWSQDAGYRVQLQPPWGDWNGGRSQNGCVVLTSPCRWRGHQ